MQYDPSQINADIGQARQDLSGLYSPSQRQRSVTPNNFEQHRQKWVVDAKRLNPSMDNDTLGKIYDQKVSPALESGRKSWQWDESPQKQADYHVQNQAKDSLTHPVEGAIGSFFDGAIRGMKDIGEGVKQLSLKRRSEFPMPQTEVSDNDVKLSFAPDDPKKLKNYMDSVNSEIKDYETKTSDHSISAGAGRLIGNLVSTLPLGEVGGIEGLFSRPLLGKMVSTSAQGATVAGLNYDPTGHNRTFNTLLGALIGAVVPGGFHGAKNFSKWLFAKPTLIDDPAVLEMAANRVKDAKELGIDGLTAGAVTQEPAIQIMEKNLMKKMGNRGAKMLQEAHKDISNQIHKVGNNMVDAIGGKPIANTILGGEIKNAARETRKMAIDRISDMYENAKDALGADQELPKNNIVHTVNKLKDEMVDLKFSPGVQKMIDNLGKGTEPFIGSNVGLANKFIRGFNVLSKGISKKALQLKETEPFDIGVANKFIKSLNAMSRRTSNKDLQMAAGVVKSSVMDSIDTLADDVHNPSRSLFNLARSIRRELGDVYDQKDIVGMLTRMKGSTTDFIPSEQVADRIFTRRESITNLNKVEKALKYEIPLEKWVKEAKLLNHHFDLSDLQNIYESKIKPQYEKNQQLWEDLKTTRFNKLIQDSTAYVNGGATLSYNKLVKNVEMLGNDSLKKILGNDELASKFSKLINTMKLWEAKPPTMKNQDGAVSALRKAVGGVVGVLGDGESRLGMYLHFPYNIVKSVIDNVNDERWVRSNLLLGSKDTSPITEIAKRDPGLVDKLKDTLKNNPLVNRQLQAALSRGGAAAGTGGQYVPTQTTAQLTGE